MTVKELRERYSFEELKQALDPRNLYDKHMDTVEALKKLVEGTILNKEKDPFWQKIKDFYAAYEEYTPGVNNNAKINYSRLYSDLFEDSSYAERLYILYNYDITLKKRPEGVRDHITYISDPDWDIPDEMDAADIEAKEEGYKFNIRRINASGREKNSRGRRK